jgi:DNA-binding transcriptional MerR regulator
VSARRPEDLLEPVDAVPSLKKLDFSLGQVCRATGVSRMQLDYWTTKARIPTKGRKQRLYDLDAIETVLLIKQGKDKGLSLQAAIDAAKRFKASRAPRVPRRN